MPKELDSLTSEIISLDKLGNSPYFTKGLVKKLFDYFTEEQYQVIEDEFALYVKVGNQNLPPIIVDTHLDHPGFVIAEDNTVHSLGSFLNSKMINQINFPEKLPVGFYAPGGQHITSGFLYKMSTSQNQITAFYQTTNNVTLPANTQVMPIFETGINNDKLSLRSIDNLATVLVCLKLLDKLQNTKELNLTFIFTKLEEIYQLSATGIAKRSSTPFEKINSHTPIIVLEVAPVLTNDQAKKGDLALASFENIFNTLSPDSKTVSLLRKVCDESKIKLHYTKLHSHGNSISYRLVAGNAETICLHVGSFNRHNIDEKGNFVSEFVYLKSLSNLEKVTYNLLKNLQENYPEPTKKITLNPDEEKKKSQLLSSYTRAYPRLKLNKLYPKSLLEYLYFAYYSLLARLHSHWGS